ncbi:hypothetical protein ACFFMO_17235 [Lederbergia wuyishanensis]|uniref:Two-component sensor histidine kinase n=1 Tax=Lederbergia wuyishanensis TaxID=1347903 RepID=A0ABU0D1C1_9BACI|nr:hypothetical protein [Lederbergia wuyishanensis]
MLAFISLFVVYEITQIYITELSYVKEMQDYYEKQIIQLLENTFDENEDVMKDYLLYNDRRR